MYKCTISFICWICFHFLTFSNIVRRVLLCFVSTEQTAVSLHIQADCTVPYRWVKMYGDNNREPTLVATLLLGNHRLPLPHLDLGENIQLDV